MWPPWTPLSYFWPHPILNLGGGFWQYFSKSWMSGFGMFAPLCRQLSLPLGNCGRGGHEHTPKISRNFMNFNPLQKPNFQSHQLPFHFSWLPFEYHSTKLGIHNDEPLYSTLRLYRIAVRYGRTARAGLRVHEWVHLSQNWLRVTQLGVVTIGVAAVRCVRRM